VLQAIVTAAAAAAVHGVGERLPMPPAAKVPSEAAALAATVAWPAAQLTKQQLLPVLQLLTTLALTKCLLQSLKHGGPSTTGHTVLLYTVVYSQYLYSAVCYGIASFVIIS